MQPSSSRPDTLKECKEICVFLGWGKQESLSFCLSFLHCLCEGNVIFHFGITSSLFLGTFEQTRELFPGPWKVGRGVDTNWWHLRSFLLIHVCFATFKSATVTVCLNLSQLNIFWHFLCYLTSILFEYSGHKVIYGWLSKVNPRKCALIIGLIDQSSLIKLTALTVSSDFLSCWIFTVT